MEKSICFTTMKQMKQYVDLPNYGDAAVYPSAAVAKEMEALVETLGVCAVQVVYDTMKNQTKTIPAHSTSVVVEATSVILFQPHYTGDLWSLPAVNLLSKLTSRQMRSLELVKGLGKEFEELVHSVGLELDEIKTDAVQVIKDPPYDPKMDD
ncbi:hypothetical protein BDR26DRAFT_919140 [Obelidium mucronatum]|nr:hypothetical protein BDR26DRAFT_919140 [Obelidium mucronatum]